ncbi:MAG: hypothetical protein IJ728_09065 [Selenomonadaceae bacterium]|nr:hypothetical protein [Selenomonadaceae bacterium]
MVAERKFDFISIDGPYGFDVSGTIPCARIDILPYLPSCLNESFCIVIDDFERQGEQNTVKIIKNILMQNNIKFSEGVYSGSKDLYLLSSEDLSWLCTM